MSLSPHEAATLLGFIKPASASDESELRKMHNEASKLIEIAFGSEFLPCHTPWEHGILVRPGVPESTHEDLTWDSGFCKPEQILTIGPNAFGWDAAERVARDYLPEVRLLNLPAWFDNDAPNEFIAALHRRIAIAGRFDDLDGDTVIISDKLEYIPGGPSVDYEAGDDLLPRYTRSVELNANDYIRRQLKGILSRIDRTSLRFAIHQALPTLSVKYPEVVIECQPDVRWVQDMKGNFNNTKALLRKGLTVKPNLIGK